MKAEVSDPVVLANFLSDDEAAPALVIDLLVYWSYSRAE